MNLNEAQRWVKEQMQTVLDDDYPDKLDDLYCRLCDYHGYSDEMASKVIYSKWWM